MGVKWESVKEGDVLYSVYKQKMCHVRKSRTVCHEIKVISIDHAAGKAVIHAQNGRETAHKYRIVRLRRSKPKEQQ